MIFLGLYLTGRWKTAIIKIENIGSVLWRRIEPLAKKFIPIRSISHALIAGILWGWLPCGLVYSALFLAMSANSISQGALIMWSFGIGTLPVLLGLGYVSTNFIAHLQKQWVRTTAGTIIICFGIFQFKILFFSWYKIHTKLVVRILRQLKTIKCLLLMGISISTVQVQDWLIQQKFWPRLFMENIMKENFSKMFG